jgi:hypothetical protein
VTEGPRTAPSAAATAPSAKAVASSGAVVLTDFSGLWKRVKATNFEDIVGAQGASYVQRKLAASLTVMHTITMNPPTLDMLRLQVIMMNKIIEGDC